MAEKKVQDFGEKIGGARKDIWSARGLLVSDLSAMNDMERNKYAKKQYVWPQPNWQQLHADGGEQAVLYWQNEMRKVFPPAPRILVSQQGDSNAAREAQERYVAFCADYRNAVMGCKSKEDIQGFLNDFLVAEGYAVGVPDYSGRIRTYRPTDKAAHCLNDKMLNLGILNDYNYARIAAEAKNKYFAIADDEKMYQYVKNNVKAVKLDGEYATAEESKNGTRIILRNSSSIMYFYDNAEKKDFEANKYLLVNLADHSIIAKNISTLAECEHIIESSARAMQAKQDKLREENKKANKKESNRKKAFSLQRLEFLNRTGPDYLGGKHAGADEYLKGLGFRACEFGNWVGDAERQKHLDMAYNSLCDLANVLGVKESDISLGGRLALGFGSRGKGGVSAGAAHYEPYRTVINLTKMSGAGCLAHEWGHALDDSLGRMVGAPSDKFLSDMFSGYKQPSKDLLDKIPPAFAEIMQLMKYKTITVTQEEAAKEKQGRLDFAKKSILRWADSVKPTKMTPAQDAQWNKLVGALIEHTGDMTGMEYARCMGYRGGTYAPLEALSDFKKQVCGRGIVKDDKYEVVHQLKNYQYILESPVEARERCVESNYYKGSKQFDQIYAKSGGYWSSDKEMFARAIDCYVEDKLKENGLRSDYLTSHASSYVYRTDDGPIYAIPYGDERKALDAKIDEFIEQAKEMGIFHAQEAQKEAIKQIEESYEIEKPKQPEQVLTEESKVEAPENLQSNKEADVPETLTNKFAACAAVYAVAPRVMDAEQKEKWRNAVKDVLADLSVDTLRALSDLRKDIVGREIPQFNLRQIGRVAGTMLEKEGLRNQKKVQEKPEERPRQMSFSDYER